MVIIFIHLYFVIVFEILFYLYYIMPYEKTLIYDLFDITKYTKNIQNYSLIEELIEHQLQCDAGQKRIDKYNHTLWLKCMWFIGILTVILVAVFVRDGWRTWKLYLVLSGGCGTITKHNSRTQLVENEYVEQNSPKAVNKSSPKNIAFDQGFTNSGISHARTAVPLSLIKSGSSLPDEPDFVNIQRYSPRHKKNDDVVNPDIVIVTDTFVLYYWKNSKFVKNMGKTIRFIILVGIFEYAFFTLIVNKYKIVNTKTLLCKMVGTSS